MKKTNFTLDAIKATRNRTRPRSTVFDDKKSYKRCREKQKVQKEINDNI